MSRRHLLAAGVAAVLGAGFVGACGNEEADRQSIKRSNEGEQQQQPSGGTPQTVETNPDVLTATGKEQPTVTQSETSP
jgi:hypothetical protein